MLEFRILGPLEVVDAGDRVGLGGSKQRATLAILLLNANRVVSVDRLADDLYAGAAPATALKQVQRHISDLRKVLGSMSVIETRSPGYVIRLSAQELDLSVFERLVAQAAEAMAAADPGHAADLLRRALGLWRGPPLADVMYESFARPSIQRLEEIRLAALEQRIDAELALGRHGELVGELEHLVAEHPVRERLRAQLMLALYRSGRQAEALTAYRQARDALMDGFGIEPGRELRQLQRQILDQDLSLDLVRDTGGQGAPTKRTAWTVLAVPADEPGVARAAVLAEPLARLPQQELILARLVGTERELAKGLGALESARRETEATVRVAAFTSTDWGPDVVRLASAYDVDLVLVDAPPKLGATQLPVELATLLDQSPADVGLVAGAQVTWTRGSGMFVPFGGTEHDWAALELAAWLAAAAGEPLRLVGVRADPKRGQRDASRLLANASLAVQRLVGVGGDPLLIDASVRALVDAVGAATLVVVGMSSRWRTHGLGAVSRSLDGHGPVVVVHRGPRPGGLAPRDARTLFSWSLAS